jgi:tetratricopeptide (TPR) repeat protein
LINSKVKVLALTFIFVIINYGFGQSLTERFYPEVCDCFENNYSEENLDLNLLGKCFDLSSEDSQKELEDYMRQELDSTDLNLSYDEGLKVGQKIGQQLFDELQEPLVNNCDSYYKFLIDCKKLTLKNMSKGVSKKEADSLSIIIKNGNWTSETMWQMGSYQLGLGNLKNAKDNFTKSLEKNPLHPPSLFFMGIVNDTEGDYEKAIDRYNQVMIQEENSLTFLVRMFLEVAKRKVKEQ